MVVGDDAQSIYSWRGANFQNILEFPKRYPDAQVFKIEMNYRSVPEILEVANAAIAANVQQFRKHLSATRESKALKPALVALNDGAEQAQFVAQRILELRDENVDLNDIAVLYRAHYHAIELQLELSRRGIPYQITSGIRFFEQAHIKDVTAFVRVVANPRDEVAFKRMVKLLPGIGNRTAENLWRSWENSLTDRGRNLLRGVNAYCRCSVPGEIKEGVGTTRAYPGRNCSGWSAQYAIGNDHVRGRSHLR